MDPIILRQLLLLIQITDVSLSVLKKNFSCLKNLDYDSIIVHVPDHRVNSSYRLTSLSPMCRSQVQAQSKILNTPPPTPHLLSME